MPVRIQRRRITPPQRRQQLQPRKRNQLSSNPRAQTQRSAHTNAHAGKAPRPIHHHNYSNFLYAHRGRR